MVEISPAIKQAMDDYCIAEDTTPDQLMAALLQEFFSSPRYLVVENTGVTIADLVMAYCVATRTLDNRGISPEEMNFLSQVRAGVQDIYSEMCYTEEVDD